MTSTVAKKLRSRLNDTPNDVGLLSDYIDVSYDQYDLNDLKAGLKLVERQMRNGRDLADYGRLHRKVLRMLARDDFDSYMRYIEYERDPDKRFYQPRRRALKVIADTLQDLHDGKL